MTDHEKTKEQLTLEIVYLKQLIAELENKYAALEGFAKETEERFLNITSAVSDYIFSVHIVEGNPVETVHGPACYAITGYAPKEFYENPYLWINMVYPEDRAIVLDHVAKILSGKEVKPLEHRIIRKDGVIRWVRNTPVCQYDSEGKLKTYDGLIQDITEIRRTFETLKLSEEKFAKAFRSSPDIITITTIADGRFLEVNDAFERESGYSRQEVIGAKSREFDLWVDYSEREELIRELMDKGKVSNKELKMRTKNGDVLVILASSELIVMGDEQCMITVARDITKRKKIFSKLQQEMSLLEENLRMQIAKGQCLSNILIEYYINLAYAEMELLNITPPEANKQGTAKTMLDFIDSLAVRLDLDIQVETHPENDSLIQRLGGAINIALIIIFRIIELRVSPLQRKQKAKIHINIGQRAITISGDYEPTGGHFLSFLGRSFDRNNAEYTLTLVARELLKGELIIYPNQQGSDWQIRV